MDVFVPVNGDLYDEYWVVGSGWATQPYLLVSGWSIASQPWATTWGSNELDIFWRDGYGTMNHYFFASGAWQGPASLAGSPPAVGNPAVLNRGPGDVEVYWRTGAGNLEHYWLLNTYACPCGGELMKVGGNGVSIQGVGSDPSGFSWSDWFANNQPAHWDVFWRDQASGAVTHTWYWSS